MGKLHIRLSQFITTFGPGSIIEGENGPILIRSPEIALDDLISCGLFNPFENEITDPSLKNRLNARILQLPSNTSLDIPDSNTLYIKPRYFPSWALCTSHNVLYKYDMREDSKFPCKKCRSELKTIDERWRKYRKDAIRFIMVCEKGHINEVPWKYVAHNGDLKKMGKCVQTTFRWESAPKMSQIRVSCEVCGTTGLLGIVNSFDKCGGRFLFKGFDEKGGECDQKPRITLRGSSSVYIPNIISAVTIPPLDDEPTRIFFKKGLDKVFEKQFARGKSFEEIVESIHDYSMGDWSKRHQMLIEELFNRGESEIRKLLRRKKEIIVMDREEATLSEIDWSIRNNEIKGIRKGTQRGVNVQFVDGKMIKDFIIDKSKVRKIDTRNFTFRITPIERLRVVMVLHSFCRLKTRHNVSLKFSFPNDPRDKWLLGIENFGEGLFIDVIEKGNIESPFVSRIISEERKNAWNKVIDDSPEQFARFPDFDINQFVQFLWYHSLSHRIIRSLSIATGYSTASIREKIYSQRIDNNLVGGVLLYTSGVGSDGSLGGLSASVKQFENILRNALWDIDDCSNDPLCVEQQISVKRPIGAACYSCMFVPETSCEFQNKYLDRQLIF